VIHGCRHRAYLGGQWANSCGRPHALIQVDKREKPRPRADLLCAIKKSSSCERR
jgi:hypothetical protein